MFPVLTPFMNIAAKNILLLNLMEVFCWICTLNEIAGLLSVSA